MQMKLMLQPTTKDKQPNKNEDEGGGRLVVRFTPAEGEWPFRFLHWVFRQFESEKSDYSK